MEIRGLDLLITGNPNSSACQARRQEERQTRGGRRKLRDDGFEDKGGLISILISDYDASILHLLDDEIILIVFRKSLSVIFANTGYFGLLSTVEGRVSLLIAALLSFASSARQTLPKFGLFGPDLRSSIGPT